jgi:hypothetical protein
MQLARGFGDRDRRLESRLARLRENLEADALTLRRSPAM